MSKDGQSFIVTGEFSFKIDRGLAPEHYDFTINPTTNVYDSDPIKLLGESVVNGMRAHFLKFAASLDIKDLNNQRHELETQVSAILAGNPNIILGAQLKGVAITGAAPDPKIAAALMASVSEKLLSEADEAIAVRAKAAEMNRRSSLLTKVETDKLHEDARKSVIEAKIENERIESEAKKAHALDELAPYVNMSPALVFAHALRNKNVDNLTITSEFFQALAGATSARNA